MGTLTPAAGAAPLFRVATLNLWGVRGDWPARRRVLRRTFADLDADLLLLQETIVRPGYDQVEDLLGDGYHRVHQSTRDPDGQGISLAGRRPLENVEELDLRPPSPDPFPAGALVATVRAAPPFGEVAVVNHFPSWELRQEREREQQAVAVARHLEARWPDLQHPVVLGGDLDAEPDAASLRYLTGRQSLDGHSVCFRDAWEARHGPRRGVTYTPDNPIMEGGDWPFRQIDHVLVRCDVHRGPVLEVEACRLFLDQPIEGVWGSDHFGLVADLRPPPAP